MIKWLMCVILSICTPNTQIQDEQEQDRMIKNHYQQVFEDDLERLYKKQLYLKNFEEMLKSGR